METYEDNLNPELKDAKLKYILMRWGIGKDDLDAIIKNDSLEGLSKNSKRKFRRHLMSLEQAFEVLSQKYGFADNLATNPAFKDYDRDIRMTLFNETKYLAYVCGEWDEDILRAVLIAQKKHMVPREAPSTEQQKRKVQFEPKSDYVRYFNR